MDTRRTKFILRRTCLAACGVVALSFACLSLLAQTQEATREGSGATRSPAAGQRGRGASQGAARTSPQTARPIRILFLGQDEEQPHNPAKMFPLLAAPMARRGIQLTYA